MLSKYKQKRLNFILSVFAISLAALIFVVINFRSNIVFFYSPSELLTPEILKKSQNREIKIGGLIVEDSLKKIDARSFQFVISDLEKTVMIKYEGILPDLFREKQGVVARGKFDQENQVFLARELLIKHDENYMPPEVAKSLKKTN